jgi:hypothetical protein
VSRPSFFYVYVISLVFLGLGSASAQIGGSNAFQFLQLPASAQVAGIGAENVSVQDKNVGLVW